MWEGFWYRFLLGVSLSLVIARLLRGKEACTCWISRDWVDLPHPIRDVCPGRRTRGGGDQGESRTFTLLVLFLSVELYVCQHGTRLCPLLSPQDPSRAMNAARRLVIAPLHAAPSLDQATQL